MQGDTYWNSGSGWDPIGSFSAKFGAIFDGGGHTISNLSINRPSASEVGLFGYIGRGGQVRRMSGCSMLTCRGAVLSMSVRWPDRAKAVISTSYATGTVKGGYYMSAGWWGSNENGTISDQLCHGGGHRHDTRRWAGRDTTHLLAASRPATPPELVSGTTDVAAGWWVGTTVVPSGPATPREWSRARQMSAGW